MTASQIPHYIKTLMLEEQVRQGNKEDWSVFNSNSCPVVEDGGFNWYESIQGLKRWDAYFVRNTPEPLRQWCLKHRPELLKPEYVGRTPKNLDGWDNKNFSADSPETITPSQAESIIFEATGRVVKIIRIA